MFDSECGLFGYAGMQFDSDSGLYQTPHGAYMPGVGRWLTQDPIGFEGDTTNLYQYAFNSPLVYTDPSGLLGAAQIINGTKQLGNAFNTMGNTAPSGTSQSPEQILQNQQNVLNALSQGQQAAQTLATVPGTFAGGDVGYGNIVKGGPTANSTPLPSPPNSPIPEPTCP